MPAKTLPVTVTGVPTPAQCKAAHDKVSKARTLLMLHCPWFGLLALKLQLEYRADIATMAVDGTKLYFGASFTLGLSDLECRSVVAHEVLHCAFKHMYNRLPNHQLDNIAADYVINQVLVDSRDKFGRSMFQLPAGALLDAQFQGMDRLQVYRILEQEQEKQGQPQQGQSGLTSDDIKAPGSMGNGNGPQDDSQAGKGIQGTGNGPQPATGSPDAGKDLTPVDWDIAIEQANRMASAGCPSAIKRSIEDAKAYVDWREVLRAFMANSLSPDTAWSRPNRRTLWSGVLPGPLKNAMGDLVFAIDTSGSISKQTLGVVWAEVMACVQEMLPERVTVLWWDSAVCGVQQFSADDIPVPNPVGGGGTEFQPVLNWIAANLEESPKCLIVLTDLEFYDTPKDPGYPVLWIVPEWVKQVGSWGGETVRVKGM